MQPDQPNWTRIPQDWAVVPEAFLGPAKMQALTSLSAVRGVPAVDRLTAYYDPGSECAGTSFADLLPAHPNDITAADLHAAGLLLARPLGSRATRRLLNDGPDRSEVLDGLRALPDTELLVAGPDDLSLMETFHLAVQTKVSSPRATGPQAWEIASKLCARKRPELFPVRDPKVLGHLGLTPSSGHRIDWQVFRYLIGDAEIIHAIDDLLDCLHVGDRRRWADSSRLRILDVAIWTYMNR